MQKHLRYNVHEKERTRPVYDFFRNGSLFTFALVIMVLLILLFPGKSLIESIDDEQNLSEIEFRYAVLLMNHITGEDIKVNAVNIAPAVIRLLDQNAREFLSKKEWNNLWLNYVILRTIVYKLPASSAILQLGRTVMIADLKMLQTVSWQPTRLIMLGDDALAFDQMMLALDFYETAIKLEPRQKSAFYEKASRAALWAGECKKSAAYSIMAQQYSSDLASKRQYYLTALKNLFMCEDYDLALSLADQQIDGLSADPLTYQALVDLALKAGKPAKAQEYIEKLLRLQSQTK